MTSALRQDWQRIFNQLPYFVAIFWISISSATTGKKFCVNWSSFPHRGQPPWRGGGALLRWPERFLHSGG